MSPRFETQFHFELIPPPADLREQINTFFFMAADVERVNEIMPAYSGQIHIITRGSATMHFETGAQTSSERVLFNAPLLQATPFSAAGPLSSFGASLTHRGWAELVRTPVDQLHHRILTPDEIFADDLAKQFQDLSSGDPHDLDRLAAQLSNAIRASMMGLAPNQVDFISQTMLWLSSGFNPAVEQLYERLTLSPRQIQRLCNRYFGAPPRRLLKRVRAVRAATLLAQPKLPDPIRDELALAFYDQSHLINDIKRYTGRTPTLLEDGKWTVEMFNPAAHGPPGAFARNALAKE